MSAADQHLVRLDQVIHAKTDATVLTQADRRNRVIHLRALEALHRDPLSGLIVDRRSTIAHGEDQSIRLSAVPGSVVFRTAAIRLGTVG
jgi:hypothetical protein